MPVQTANLMALRSNSGMKASEPVFHSRQGDSTTKRKGTGRGSCDPVPHSRQGRPQIKRKGHWHGLCQLLTSCPAAITASGRLEAWTCAGKAQHKSHHMCCPVDGARHSYNQMLPRTLLTKQTAGSALERFRGCITILSAPNAECPIVDHMLANMRFCLTPAR